MRPRPARPARRAVAPFAAPLVVVVFLFLLLIQAPSRARADERVPLTENFPVSEIVLIGALGVADVALFIWQDDLVEVRGEPNLDDPWSWDRDVSDALYPGAGSGRFLGGAPDVGGQFVLPALALGYYGADAVALWTRGRSLTGDVNADHEFLAFAEAYAVTLAATQLAKLAVGRERPVYGLEREGAPPRDVEATLSFFSGHSSSSFCIAAFVSRDLGDALGPRLGTFRGRVLPAAALYGIAALVGLSRVIDQQHYVTDVLLGAAVGGVAGNLFYDAHFDDDGRPKRRRGRGEIRLVAIPGGLGLTGSF